MSQENVEAILRGMDDFNNGNDEAYAALAHPDVEWDAGLLGTPTYRGREGIRKMLRDVRAAWADLQAEVVGTPTDIETWVLWEVRLRGHGRTTVLQLRVPCLLLPSSAMDWSSAEEHLPARP